MTRLLTATAALAIAASSSPVFAQARAVPTQAIVVDNARIFDTCTACVAAQAQLKTQADSIQTRGQQLAAPLQAEGQAIQAEDRAIQAAVTALQGKAPDAALQARASALQSRAQTFQQRQQDAQKEISDRQEAWNRNRAFVGQQIKAKLDPIVVATMKARGANLALDANPGFVLAYEGALDATNDVLAQLNAQLPSVSTVAPAPAPAPAAPKPPGR